MANKFVNFFKEVKIELSKVAWSTREELTSATIVVLVSVALLGVFIGFCDLIFSRLVTVIMTGL